jgi:hypothetical protein
MDGIDGEELSQGRTGPPPSLLTGRTLLAVTALAVAVGAGLFLTRGSGSPEPDPVVAPSLHRSATGLGVAAVCPAVTDRRDRLAVSFELRNSGPLDVTLTNVEPHPTGPTPAAGSAVPLRPAAAASSGGSCGAPGSEAAGGLLRPGQTRLITFRFRPPSGCPRTAATRVTVRPRVSEMVGTTTVPVRRDLGPVEFDPCPGAGARE